jgi:hypothetical protein
MMAAFMAPTSSAQQVLILGTATPGVMKYLKEAGLAR